MDTSAAPQAERPRHLRVWSELVVSEVEGDAATTLLALSDNRVGLAADDLHAVELDGRNELIRGLGLFLGFEDDQAVP